MAAIWADFPSGSHGLYGTDEAAMLDGVWADQFSCQLQDDPDPAIGSSGKVLYIGSGSNANVRFVLPSAQTTLGLGRRVYMTNLPDNAAGVHVFEWLSAGGDVIAYIMITSTGAITFFNRYDNATIATTSGPVVTASAWWHIEAALTCSNSGAAEIEVRVNGVPKLTHSGFTTGTGTSSGAVSSSSQFSMATGDFGTTTGGESYCKDLIVWDGSGSEVNDFQGTVQVYFNPVVTDIATTGWGFSSGSDASALIGHAGPPVDTDYVSAGDPPPSPMQLELADLPPDVTSVRFIVPVVRAAKVDGGDGNIQIALSPDGTNFDTGPDTPITTAFTYWGNASASFVSMLNPATSSAWTPADFANGIRLQIDRTV